MLDINKIVASICVVMYFEIYKPQSCNTANTYLTYLFNFPACSCVSCKFKAIINQSGWVNKIIRAVGGAEGTFERLSGIKTIYDCHRWIGAISPVELRLSTTVTNASGVFYCSRMIKQIEEISPRSTSTFAHCRSWINRGLRKTSRDIEWNAGFTTQNTNERVR